jgi:hypothetical protein
MKRSLVLPALLALSGCPDPYVKATGTFADAVKSGTDALGDVPGFAHTLCRSHALFSFTSEHVRPPAPAWGTLPQWAAWYESHPLDPADPKSTMKAHCDAIDSGNQIILNALSILNAYGQALNTIADGAGYSGTDLSNAASKAGDLAKALPDGSAAASVLQAIADPLTDLANVIFQQWAEKELREAVKRGGPPFKKLISALEQYLAAVRAEQGAEALQREHAVAAFEAEMAHATPPNDPGRTITLVNYLRDTDAMVTDHQRTLDRFDDLLKQLAHAHAALESAASDKSKETDNLKDALSAVATAVNDANKVISTLRTKE